MIIEFRKTPFSFLRIYIRQVNYSSAIKLNFQRMHFFMFHNGDRQKLQSMIYQNIVPPVRD